MAVGSIYLTGLTIPPAQSVNAAAGAQQRTVSAAADRTVIPLIYGEVQATADVLNIIEHATDANAYLLQVMWCHACDDIGTPLLNGLALPGDATFTHYTGTQTTADSALVAAFAAKSITYTDTLEGIAYSVLKLPTKEFTGQLTVTAVVRGRKVYDPRLDSTQPGGLGSHRLADAATWEWSDNPALCLADWINSAAYGADDSTVWASVPAAADANDAMVGTGPTEKRRTLNLAITEPVRVADMAEALRAYAGCWLVPTRYGISLLPDADDASAATYSHSSGHIAAIGNITTRDLSGSPTAVEVTYTDDSQTPSRDGTALAALPGAGDTLPWRQSSVRLPGIKRYSQALREATERLNKLNLGAYSTTLDVFDIGIRHEIGDIITVSHPAGLVDATMRITDAPQMPSIGHWRLPVTQHDPLAYDDGVYTIPGYGNPGRVIAPGPPSDVTNMTSSVSNAIGSIDWDPCPDVDYSETEVRPEGDENWGSNVVMPAFRGKANGWRFSYATTGTYHWCARHIDQSGQISVNSTCVEQSVSAGDLGGGGGPAAVYKMTATPAVHIIQLDPNGAVQSWAGAKSTLTVATPAGDDDTANWAYSIDTAYSTLTGSISGNVVSIDGWGSDLVDPLWGQVKFFMPFDGALEEVRMGYAVQSVDGGSVSFPTATDEVWLDVNGANSSGASDKGVLMGLGSGADAIVDLNLDTGDLCLDGEWVLYNPGIGRPRSLVEVREIGAGVICSLIERGDGYFAAEFFENSTTQRRLLSDAPAVANTRYHLAFTRQGNVHRLFVNGVLQSGAFTTSYRRPAGPRRVTVACTWFGTGSPNYYIDSLYGRVNWVRCTAAARFTSSFTPLSKQPPRGYLNGAAMRVVGTRSGYSSLEAFISVFTQKTTPPAQISPGLVAYATPTLITLAARMDGTALTSTTAGLTTLADAAIGVSIKRAGIEQAAAWTVTPEFTSGLGGFYGGISGTTGLPYVRINSMAKDTEAGTITLRCERTGYSTIRIPVAVNKSKTFPNVGMQSWVITNDWYSAKAPNVSGGSSAALKFTTNGYVVRIENGIERIQQAPWFTPVGAGIGADYEVQFVVTSGDTPTGVTLGAWLRLNVDRTVTLSYSGGPKACNLQINLRPYTFTSPVLGGQSYLIAD